MKARPVTDLYLRTVELAVATPGTWIAMERRFRSRYNATKTAACLEGGYLRVEPRDGDAPVRAEGRDCIATPARVTAKVEPRDSEFVVLIRFGGG